MGKSYKDNKTGKYREILKERDNRKNKHKRKHHKPHQPSDAPEIDVDNV